MLALLVAIAILAPWISPHDPEEQSLLSRLDPPAWMAGGDWSYPLGSDGLGRDVLSNIFFGLRVSLLVGFVAVAISVVIGGVAGLVAGYRSGGWFDTVAMRLVDIQLALPAVLIALAVLRAQRARAVEGDRRDRRRRLGAVCAAGARERAVGAAAAITSSRRCWRAHHRAGSCSATCCRTCWDRCWCRYRSISRARWSWRRRCRSWGWGWR